MCRCDAAGDAATNGSLHAQMVQLRGRQGVGGVAEPCQWGSRVVLPAILSALQYYDTLLQTYQRFSRGCPDKCSDDEFVDELRDMVALEGVSEVP